MSSKDAAFRRARTKSTWPMVAISIAACSEPTARPEPAPFTFLETETVPILFSVADTGRGDVYLAGGFPGRDTGVLVRFDGQSFEQMPLPPGDALWWVAALPTGEIFASGEKGRIVASRGGPLRSQDSGLPETKILYGIWGADANDLWSVGGDPRITEDKGIVLRSSGDGRWTRIFDPSIPTDSSLFKVWGSAADDVFIVGEAGVAIHFDGTGFTRSDLDPRATLFTVHGRAGGPILAVGSKGGKQGGLVYRYEAGAWIQETLPPDTMPLFGVSVGADGIAFASGDGRTILRRELDGRWVSIHGGAEGAGSETYHAVSAGPRVWAVGGDLTTGDHGLIGASGPALPSVAPIDELPPMPARDGGVAEPDGSTDAEIRDADTTVDGGVDGSSDGGVDGGSDAVADGGVDASADSGADGGLDASRPDAGDTDAGNADASTRGGPGEPCGVDGCLDDLECWPVANAGWIALCMARCSSPAECVGYGPSPCCVIPGPQLLDPYCIPSSAFDGGTCQ